MTDQALYCSKSSRSGGAAVSVRTVLLYYFVVNAHDQERWRPLADEKRPVVLTHDLQDGRSGHGADGGSKVAHRRNLGGLRFNAGGELVFALTACAGGRAGKGHRETPCIWEIIFRDRDAVR